MMRVFYFMIPVRDFFDVFLRKKTVEGLHWPLDLKSIFVCHAKSFFPGILLLTFEVFVLYFVFLGFTEPFWPFLTKVFFGVVTAAVLLPVVLLLEFSLLYAWANLHYFVGRFVSRREHDKEKFVFLSLYLFSSVNFFRKIFFALPLINFILCPLVMIYSLFLYADFIKRFFAFGATKAWIVILILLNFLLLLLIFGVLLLAALWFLLTKFF